MSFLLISVNFRIMIIKLSHSKLKIFMNFKYLSIFQNITIALCWVLNGGPFLSKRKTEIKDILQNELMEEKSSPVCHTVPI